MKKLLAMVLALVMTLSLAVSANAAFKDADKVSDTYEEAVAVLNGMGVFQGYEDGSFQPQGNITRAEVAAIVYRVYTADVKDAKASMYATYNKFSDMTGAGWAAGYIGYCANAELVKGYPNGTFQPSGKVTGYEVLAMILRAIGYDKNGEFSGADWALHVAQTAQQAGVLANVKGVDLNAAATRELVAELLFRAIADANMVTYTAAFGYQTDKALKLDQSTLGYKSFKLQSDDTTADAFGRPTVTWTYNVGDKKTVVDVEALATYTEAAKNCDIYADSGLKKGTKLDVYTNSAAKDGTYTVADDKNDSKQADQGRLTLVYEDRLVNIDTYLAEVTKVVAEKTDSKGHVTAAYVLANIFDLDAKKYDNKFETEGFKVDDMVLVTVADGDIQSMVAAESKTGVLTDVSGNAKTITDIQKVTGIDKAESTVNCTAKAYIPEAGLTLGKTYNFYFDTYGNVIGADSLASNYAVLDSLYMEHSKGVDTAYGDLYFFDGDSKTDVTINEVDGNDVTDFEVSASKNKDYYYTVYAYSVDKDGAYTLDDSDFVTAQEGNYISGSKFLTAGNKQLQLSKDSVILLQTKDSPKGTFTTYTGYDKLPSFAAESIQYTLDGNGYVNMVYAYAYEFSSRTVFVYDTTAYSSHWNDGKPYATFKALELTDGEMKDTTVDIYYDDYNEVSHDLENIGLYEITEGTDGIWYAIEEYEADTITKITNDGSRVLIDGYSYDLDDAEIVKYTGTWEKGEYDLDWTAKDLVADRNAFGYVQFDEDGKNVVAVYDLWIKVDVTVDSKATSNVEYSGRDFTAIKVSLNEYEKIASAKMGSTDLTVKYYAADGTEVSMNETKGTKVAYAVISYADPVTNNVVITTANQAAYSDATLVSAAYWFEAHGQAAVVENRLGHNITVYKNDGDVTAEDLLKVLANAKAVDSQSLQVYNTTTAGGAQTGLLTSDSYVKVTAWDGKTSVNYQITLIDSAYTIN